MEKRSLSNEIFKTVHQQFPAIVNINKGDCRMSNNDTRIELVTTVTPEHWDLLLSADPSKKLVQNYLQSGMLFAQSKDGHPIAVMVLQELTSDKIEIKEYCC